MVDEPFSDPLSPLRRFDEKAVQLKVAIGSRHGYRKAQDLAVPVRNPGPSCFNLLCR